MLTNSWAKIGSLATLQAAISLTWLIYNTYLPKLLASYGFAPEFGVILLITENALGAILEPLMGGLSDRTYRWFATKFGFISLGVIASSALFILIPAIVIFRDIFSAINWILPAVIIVWSIAMTVFRSPALSLIGKYAGESQLPIAVSFLTMAGGVVGAAKPVVQSWLLLLGAPVAFTIGSIVLLAATALLRHFDPPTTPDVAVESAQQIAPINFGVIIGAGLGIAWGSRCLMETLPKVLKVQFPSLDTSMVMVGIGLAIAISAIPGGIFASKVGNHRAMSIGISATAIALLMMVLFPINILTIIAILLVIICLNLVNNGAIPLALGLFPRDRAGLGVGLYFGSFSAGMSLFSSIFNPVTMLTPTLGAIVGSIAFGIAGVCIWLSFRAD